MIDRSDLLTSEVLRYSHALQLHQGRKIGTIAYRRVRQRLAEIADRIGRASTRGRPWIWRLKDIHPQTALNKINYLEEKISPAYKPDNK